MTVNATKDRRSAEYIWLDGRAGLRSTGGADRLPMAGPWPSSNHDKGRKGMPTARPWKVRVTVVRKVDMRTIHPDEDMGNADRMEPVCQVFDVGDEFIVDGDGCPEGFCQGRLSTSSDS
jgi:hypothetical protein